MTEYQTAMLSRQGYALSDEQTDDWVLFIYTRTAEYGDTALHCSIEVYDSADPDLMTYQGTATVADAEGRKVAGWDTGRRHRLTDALNEIDRFAGMVKKMHAHLTKQKG